ncbi:hypothetical protein C0J52_28014 [Blattella germanica]|nr:hypothetical protein C0J52_28014 [Blattella germanica]
MWTEQQKVQCVLWFAELKSVTSVQRRIRREWNVDPPSRKSIYEWDRTLRDRGSLISKTGKHPKKNLAEMAVDQVRESFTRSPHIFCVTAFLRASKLWGALLIHLGFDLAPEEEDTQYQMWRMWSLE